MKQIVIFGAGGHAAVIIDILKAQIANGEQIEIKGLLDDSNKTECLGYPVLGPMIKANHLSQWNTEYIVAIGSNTIRKKIAHKYRHLKFYTAIHPTAIIGSNVTIEEGTVVMPRAIINANTKIGRHVIINSGAIIEHDNMISHCVHVSPNATLCGTVTVHSGTHIGANATVIQGVRIGREVVVGAGATVINDIPNEMTVVGTPARDIKTRNQAKVEPKREETESNEGTYLLSITPYE